jgi:hypothetical protein
MMPIGSPIQSAFTSSNSTTLVSPVMGTMTPGDSTIILLPSDANEVYPIGVEDSLTGCSVNMSR